MEESISSSRTTAVHGANSYQHQPPPPPSPPASEFEDADDDSGWTAYFLQLASDEEEDASASSREKQLRLRDVVGGVSKPKPNKDKHNKQPVEKKGVVKKKTKDDKVLHLVGSTCRILEEEDPLQDTASSPLVPRS